MRREVLPGPHAMKILRDETLRFLLNESGASAAEYALILAIVGAAIALSAIALGGSISNSMDRAGNEIRNCGGGC
jgi:pilus assembly protein Flp/PilA